MFCSHCGAPTDENAVFCSKCGSPILNEAPKAAQTSVHLESTPPPETRINCFPSAQMTQKPQAQKPNHHSKKILTDLKIFIQNLKTKLSVKKIIVILSVLLIAVTSFSVLFHKSDEEKITDCLNQVATAYNEADYEMLLECFEPKARTAAKSAMGLGSSYFGMDLEAMWKLGAALGSSTGQLTLRFSVNAIVFNEEKTQATVNVTAYEGDKNSGSNDLTFIKDAGKWYLAMEGGLF